ncbi:MAG TPA: YceI family protein [Conexibacter sp.]|jgi:polyisoprenoid-binding protein YceI
MSSNDVDAPSELGLPVGAWRSDRQRSHIGFEVKTFWGLATVKGTFVRFDGSLQVAPEAATGELSIDATSLDTSNLRRDEHLRSAEFFDIERHPTITFAVAAITSRSGGGLLITGDLQVASKTLRLQLPVELDRQDRGRLRLRTSATVSREEVGMTWNRAGMVRGGARLVVDVELEPAHETLPGSNGVPTAQPVAR